MATISAGNHPHGPAAPGHDLRPIATGPSGTDVPSPDAARPERLLTDHGPYRATATLSITSALDHSPYSPYRATATLSITSALHHSPNNRLTQRHPAVPSTSAPVQPAARTAGASPC